jgi:hypothetical protein
MATNPYKGTPYEKDWDAHMAANPGTAVGTPTITKTDPFALSESTMRSQSSAIEAEENRRYGEGVGGAKDAYASLTKALLEPTDTSLLFSKASDAIGARGGGQMDALRTSLGARGLNPNSGAASGLLQRLMFNQENALVGAQKDIAIDAKARRDTNAATAFAAALNLNDRINAPVSQIGLDTTTNIYEGQIAKYGIDKQAKSAKKANESNMLGGLLGAGASILTGLFA